MLLLLLVVVKFKVVVLRVWEVENWFKLFHFWVCQSSNRALYHSQVDTRP